MGRLARTVAPGYPHYVTQRGNRRLPVFFCDEDYQAYVHLGAEHAAAPDAPPPKSANALSPCRTTSYTVRPTSRPSRETTKRASLA